MLLVKQQGKRFARAKQVRLAHHFGQCVWANPFG
jgi:hypothetical protein